MSSEKTAHEIKSDFLMEQVHELAQKHQESYEKWKNAKNSYDEKKTRYFNNVFMPFYRTGKALAQNRKLSIRKRCAILKDIQVAYKKMKNFGKNEQAQVFKLQFEAIKDQHILQHTMKLFFDLQHSRLNEVRSIFQQMSQLAEQVERLGKY
ncbi:unnamed protein product [Caenorhabditis angaria]|uniref:Uncharacterized protein n=1 Tax=Caenorhabditis angaria TaxID=860376 RepID=A0A9P1IEH3_9PELO|nr:unnamed protein product [Caenorhabditis angaria]